MVNYAQWTAQPEGDARQGYLALNLGLKRTRTVLRFRMGAKYTLPVYNRDIPERQERLCQCCDCGALGDERHLLFECPATQGVRDKYVHLQSPRVTMQTFMWPPTVAEMYAVACSICNCVAIHDKVA